MVYEVYGVTRATKNYPKRETTINSFSTRQEAESFLAQKDRKGRPISQGLGYDIISIREVEEPTGYKEIGQPISARKEAEERARKSGATAEPKSYEQIAGRYVDTTELSQQQIELIREQLKNVEKAVEEKKLNKLEADRLREQITQPERFKVRYGYTKDINLTPENKSILQKAQTFISRQEQGVIISKQVNSLIDETARDYALGTSTPLQKAIILREEFQSASQERTLQDFGVDFRRTPLPEETIQSQPKFEVISGISRSSINAYKQKQDIINFEESKVYENNIGLTLAEFKVMEEEKEKQKIIGITSRVAEKKTTFKDIIIDTERVKEAKEEFGESTLLMSSVIGVKKLPELAVFIAGYETGMSIAPKIIKPIAVLGLGLYGKDVTQKIIESGKPVHTILEEPLVILGGASQLKKLDLGFKKKFEVTRLKEEEIVYTQESKESDIKGLSKIEDTLKLKGTTETKIVKRKKTPKVQKNIFVKFKTEGIQKVGEVEGLPELKFQKSSGIGKLKLTEDKVLQTLKGERSKPEIRFVKEGIKPFEITKKQEPKFEVTAKEIIKTLKLKRQTELAESDTAKGFRLMDTDIAASLEEERLFDISLAEKKAKMEANQPDMFAPKQVRKQVRKRLLEKARREKMPDETGLPSLISKKIRKLEVNIKKIKQDDPLLEKDIIIKSKISGLIQTLDLGLIQTSKTRALPISRSQAMELLGKARKRGTRKKVIDIDKLLSRVQELTKEGLTKSEIKRIMRQEKREPNLFGQDIQILELKKQPEIPEARKIVIQKGVQFLEEPQPKKRFRKVKPIIGVEEIKPTSGSFIPAFAKTDDYIVYEENQSPTISLKDFQETKPIISLKDFQETKPIISLKDFQETKPIISLKDFQETKPIISLKDIQQAKPIIKVGQEQIPKTYLDLIMETTQIKQPKIKQPKTGKPPSISFFGEDEEKRKDINSYNVYVREGMKKRNKFIKANKSPLTRNRALLLGAVSVDNTTSRSFRISRTGISKKPDISPFGLDELLGKFRKPKGKSRLPTGTYVEKSKYSIDSLGELQGIPFKAKALRMRGLI